jgi:formylglycine-generating enzyme required for sulfatase activity
MKKLAILLLSANLLFHNRAEANNLQIGNTSVSGNTISFSISWDNSWFTTLGAQNYDAVWVFVKRQSCINNLWTHATVSSNSTNHSVTGGLLQVDAANDGMGVFIRRTGPGSGNISTAMVTLQLQTATNAVDNFQVHGIEMVFAPEGQFQIGNATQWSFNQITITSAIQSSGMDQSTYGSPWSLGNLPGSFPFGFNAFYAMKYEISQEQYAAFLNSLSYNQQATRMAANPNSAVGTQVLGGFRNGLQIQTPGQVSNVPAVIGSNLNGNGTFNENGDGQNIACNFLAWRDLTAFLDWAALRPMTEFEYEKLCRGTVPRVVSPEYAWGSSGLTSAGGLNNAGTNSETAVQFGEGLVSNSTNHGGPIRCGFAAGITTRTQAGAGFYGSMDLSGNVSEHCVGGGGNINLSFFTTANGDGTLDANGNSNGVPWPSNGGWGNGTITRGGNWRSASVNNALLETSNRNDANANHYSVRADFIGGRGVRSF